jgi:hypothetical protein
VFDGNEATTRLAHQIKHAWFSIHSQTYTALYPSQSNPHFTLCLLLDRPPPVVHFMIGRHRPNRPNIPSPPPLLLLLLMLLLLLKFPLLLSYWWWRWSLLGPEFTAAAAAVCCTCMRMIPIKSRGRVETWKVDRRDDTAAA